MPTQLDMTRRALAEIGTRSKITSMTDGSAEATYANLLYAPLRDFLLREGDYDWALATDNALPGGAASYPWLFAYQYPVGALRVRQVILDAPDYWDPRPTPWAVVPILPPTGPELRVMTRAEAGAIVYTISILEDMWDSIFQESFVRLLGSALAFALENRIEASQTKLNEALSFAGIANLRDS